MRAASCRRACRWPVAERRWVDPALATALTLLALIGLATEGDMPGTPLAAALVVAMGATIAFRRTNPLTVAGVAIALLLASAGLDGNFPPAAAAPIPFLLSYSWGAHAPFRGGLVAV